MQGLEYRWVQTGRLSTAGPLTAISWNLEGTRLLTGGALLQLWHQTNIHEDEPGMNKIYICIYILFVYIYINNYFHPAGGNGGGVTFEIGGCDKEGKHSEEEEPVSIYFLFLFILIYIFFI